MNKKQLTKELYESPMRERNLERNGHADYQCICCMKLMKESECDTFVHMNTNWVAVHPDVSEDNCEELTGAESQGCWPIGKSCAKKMKGFTFTYKNK